MDGVWNIHPSFGRHAATTFPFLDDPTCGGAPPHYPLIPSVVALSKWPSLRRGPGVEVDSTLRL